MRLYLMQHGEAMREEQDPARPLTEKGWADTRRVIRHAVERAGVHVTRICHSGKLRARQTAEVWREHLSFPIPITEVDGLDPMASPEIWSQRLGEETGDVLLVGHLPHLARLAALLVCGTGDKEPITFRNGGLVCLQRAERGGWSVRWILTPDVL
ncbi:MAG TPA: phosphohistidine phosphatase SixA [bacterium]|nr:phosphohistidine phosphatase SixA [bacterium]